jgi:tRNA pseudouridine38-40 synthase
MRRIKLTLAYDGTRFAGWQSQEYERTVQAVLEQVLEKIHGKKVTVVGAGRTDSGVHATGQVAHFDSDHATIPSNRFTDAINACLPHDVRVLESVEADPAFHARYSARLRVYRYYIYNVPIGFPHLRHCCWRIRQPLDINALNRFAALLAGNHDFTSFAAALDPALKKAESKIRTIVSSAFFRDGDFIVYNIAAPGFLWKMVRTIVGTIVESVALGRSETDFLSILEARDRKRAGRTAPARGLFLEKVHYE